VWGSGLVNSNGRNQAHIFQMGLLDPRGAERVPVGAVYSTLA
jgi:hypothetical protein